MSRMFARDTCVAALCVGAPVAFAPAATAAVPTPIGDRTIDANTTSLDFDRAGNAVASWRGQAGMLPDNLHAFVALAGRAPGGAWRPSSPIPTTVVSHDVAVSPAGKVALVTLRQLPVSGGRSSSTVVLNVSGSQLMLSRPIVLDSGPARPVTFEGPQPTLALPRVGISNRGEIVVAWQRSHPRADAGVWVGVLRADGRLLRKRKLAVNAGVPFLTIAPDGTGLVAWQRGRRLLSRRRTASGRWAEAEPVATAPGGQYWQQLESVALTGSGRRFVVTAILTQRSSAGVAIRVSAHVRIPKVGWRAGVLGEYRFNATGFTAFVTDRLRAIPLITTDGRLRVVWPAMLDGHVRVAVTRLYPERGGVGTGPPVPASNPAFDIAIEDAATGPDGRYAFTWFDLSDGQGTPSAAQAAATGALRVTPPLATERALRGAQIAYDPVSGQPAVAWTEGSSPQGYRPVWLAGGELP